MSRARRQRLMDLLTSAPTSLRLPRFALRRVAPGGFASRASAGPGP